MKGLQMFDLENKIKQWRAELQKGDLESEQIEELERHLRDSILQLTANGCSAKEAWKEAIVDFGKPATVTNEFSKLDGCRRPNRFTVACAFSSIFGLLIIGRVASPMVPPLEGARFFEVIRIFCGVVSFENILNSIDIYALGALFLSTFYLFVKNINHRLTCCYIAIIYSLIWVCFGFVQPESQLPLLTPLTLSNLPLFYYCPLFIPEMIFGEPDSWFYTNEIYLFLVISLWHWTWLILFFQEAALKKWVLKLVHVIKLVPWTRKYYLIKRKV